jgi:pimeloyl-ACP methyl ester carboxylesterase
VNDAPELVALARGELAVWSYGSGPVVLVVHGFPDHAPGMRGLGEGLAAAGYRAVLPALPGYLPSAAPADGSYAMADIARDLVALLDHLDADRAHVVGHDWGGIVGYRLGAEHAARVASLTALAVPHDAGFAVRRRLHREQQTGAYAWILAYAGERHAIAADPAFLTAAASDWSPGLHRRDWPDVLALLTQPAVAEAVCAYYRTDIDGTDGGCGIVQVPTLVVHGADDGCIGPALFQGLEAQFAAPLTTVEWPGIGHWPHLEAPEATLAAILGHLRSHP